MDKNALPIWALTGLAHLGQKEKKPGDNGDIQLMFALAGHPQITTDETAWCAAFVGSCLERVGLASTESLLARSYLKWGDDAGGPKIGSIAIFPRGNSDWQGHVGFVADIDLATRRVLILGGNQSNSVSLQWFDLATALGYRWPSAEPWIAQDFSDAIRPVAGGFDFDLANDSTWGVEGAWSDHPSDPGGKTMRGITLERYRQWTGKKSSGEDLKSITNEELRKIYYVYYWAKTWCDQLPPGVALMHFDCAVNQGPGDAARFLQRALGVTEDGDIGPATIRAVKKAPPDLLIERYSEIRMADYRSLSKWSVFGKGWTNRLQYIEYAAKEMALPQAPPLDEPGMPAPIPPTQEPPLMTDQNVQPPKWWLESITMWGAIITAVAAYAPYISFFTGFPINEDMVRLFGEAVTIAMQNTGIAVGILLTVVGRLKAKTSLTSKELRFKL